MSATTHHHHDTIEAGMRTDFNPQQYSDDRLLAMLATIHREIVETIGKINANYRSIENSPTKRDALRSRLFQLYDQWNAIEADLDRRRI